MSIRTSLIRKTALRVVKKIAIFVLVAFPFFGLLPLALWDYLRNQEIVEQYHAEITEIQQDLTRGNIEGALLVLREPESGLGLVHRETLNSLDYYYYRSFQWIGDYGCLWSSFDFDSCAFRVWFDHPNAKLAQFIKVIRRTDSEYPALYEKFVRQGRNPRSYE